MTNGMNVSRRDLFKFGGLAAITAAGAGGGDGGEAAELEQVAARNIHSVSHDGSLSLTRDAELL